MVLTGAVDERVAALGYDFAAQPKRAVDRCDLCGESTFVVIAHRDRYGFATQAAACTRCGLVFLDPVMTGEAYGDFYRSVYRPLVSAFHGRRIDAETIEPEQRAYAEALSRLLEPWAQDRRGRRLLDVGGSTGVVAQAMADRFSLRATVLDPSPEELARAAARGLETLVGSIEDADLPRVFDVALVCQTADHLLELGASLRKVRSALVEGGLLFLDIVDFRAAYLRGWSVEAAVKIDHPYSLTQATVEAYLARAGFRPLRTDFAADHLHIGFVCAVVEPDSEALPERARTERFLEEIRFVQNAPPPG